MVITQTVGIPVESDRRSGVETPAEELARLRAENTRLRRAEKERQLERESCAGQWPISSYDNALAESFFQSLKREWLHGRGPTSKARTRLELFEW